MAERRGIARFAGIFGALVLAAAVAACGSSSPASSSASAQQLLKQTFSGSHTVKSGVLSLSLTLTPSGSSTLNGPISLSLSGPFQSRGAGKPPESNFTVGLDALGQHGQLGLVSTGNQRLRDARRHRLSAPRVGLPQARLEFLERRHRRGRAGEARNRAAALAGQPRRSSATRTSAAPRPRTSVRASTSRRC